MGSKQDRGTSRQLVVCHVTNRDDLSGEGQEVRRSREEVQEEEANTGIWFSSLPSYYYPVMKNFSRRFYVDVVYATCAS